MDSAAVASTSRGAASAAVASTSRGAASAAVVASTSRGAASAAVVASTSRGAASAAVASTSRGAATVIRKRPFTDIEKELLSTIVSRYMAIVENRKTDGVSSQKKEAVWNKITTEYNSAAIISEKANAKQLKKLWINLKARAREGRTKENQRNYTGGGPSIPDMDPEAQHVLATLPSLMPTIAVDFDSDNIQGPDTERDNNDNSWRHNNSSPTTSAAAMNASYGTPMDEDQDTIPIVIEVGSDPTPVFDGGYDTPSRPQRTRLLQDNPLQQRRIQSQDYDTPSPAPHTRLQQDNPLQRRRILASPESPRPPPPLSPVPQEQDIPPPQQAVQAELPLPHRRERPVQPKSVDSYKQDLLIQDLEHRSQMHTLKLEHLKKLQEEELKLKKLETEHKIRLMQLIEDEQNLKINLLRQ